MKFRVTTFAIAAAAWAGTAGAQPDQKPQRTHSPAPVAAPPVVLASANDVRRASPANPDQSMPVRRPAPRVTTCRCGDAKAGQDQSVDQQPDE